MNNSNKVFSCIFIGIIFAITSGFLVQNYLLLIISFAIGAILGSFDSVSKFISNITESNHSNNEISMTARVIIAVVLTFVISMLAGGIFRSANAVIISIPIVLLFGYSTWGAGKIINLGRWMLGERRRLNQLREEEAARHKGRIDAERAMGVSNSGNGRPIYINIRTGGYSSEGGIKSPKELTADYKRANEMAKEKFAKKTKEMDEHIFGKGSSEKKSKEMRKRIWGK